MNHVLFTTEEDGYHAYKANLHCHSTFSDGTKTPEQLKKDYMAHGYSAIAFSDHKLFIRHNELTDENFVALNACEIDIEDSDYSVPYSKRGTCHFNIIAKSPDQTIQPCFHRTKYLGPWYAKYADLVHFDETKPDYERSYTPECINDMMRQMKEAGFYVTLNHPSWSRENFPIFSKYTEMDALEICNYESNAGGYPRNDNAAFQDLLRLGRKIACVGADDNHNDDPDGSPYCKCYGGYTVFSAKELTYASLIDALENKRFYAVEASYDTEGPKIRYIAYDDETREVTVKCSPAVRVWIVGKYRGNPTIASFNPDITEFKKKIDPRFEFFRVVVTDEHGYHAFSNPYFLEDLK